MEKVAQENLTNKPVDMGLFDSVYDPNAKHGLLYKLTMRFIKKELEKQGMDTSKRLDYWDWDGIRVWTRGLADMLKQWTM